jgi:hypothetical protein
MSVAASSVSSEAGHRQPDARRKLTMIIDCHSCQARGIGCSQCAATTLIGDEYQDLDPAEIRALTVLANAGMIPPLRYAPRLARAS